MAHVWAPIANSPYSLRPNTVTIDRRATSLLVDAAGEQEQSAPTVVAVGLPVHIDYLIPSSIRAGGFAMTAAGREDFSSHVMFVDGVMRNRVPPGTLPGAIFWLQNIPFRLAMNGRAGLIDVRDGDRVTDEEGAAYLVVAVNAYYDITPHIEVALRHGAAWT